MREDKTLITCDACEQEIDDGDQIEIRGYENGERSVVFNPYGYEFCSESCKQRWIDGHLPEGMVTFDCVE